MNSCLVKYSKCKCMYIWVIVIFPSLGTLWEQHLHPTPCHQGQEQQLWPTRGSGQSQAVLVVQRRDPPCPWLLLVSWSLVIGKLWWPCACGVGLLLLAQLGSWTKSESDSSERQPAPWLLCSSLQTGHCEKHNSDPKTSALLQLENPDTEFQGDVKHQDKSVVLPCAQIQVGLSKVLLRKRNQRTCLFRTV